MLLTSCYVPCVPSSEEERKQGSHEQELLTLHTSLAHVEKSGTHMLRWEEEEKGNIKEPQHMHHNVLGDVGMRYSLAAMFHVFPVVKRRENTAAMSKDHCHCTHRCHMWKRVALTC